MTGWERRGREAQAGVMPPPQCHSKFHHHVLRNPVTCFTYTSGHLAPLPLWHGRYCWSCCFAIQLFHTPEQPLPLSSTQTPAAFAPLFHTDPGSL